MPAATTSVKNSRLAGLAGLTTRYRWPVIGLWLVLTVIGGVAAGKLSSRWYQSLSVPGQPAYEASQRSLDELGAGVRAPNDVVFHSNGDVTKSPAIRLAARASRTCPLQATSRQKRL